MSARSLLPFKGQIIYDGLLSPYNIFFGSGIKSSLHEEYIKKQQKKVQCALWKLETVLQRVEYRGSNSITYVWMAYQSTVIDDYVYVQQLMKYKLFQILLVN